MSSVSVRKERLDRGIKVRAESLYLLSSWREMTYMILPRAALIVGLIVLPLVMPTTYWVKVLCTMGVIALLAISFDFLANYAGLVCLGGGLWTGVGGYISGVLDASFELPIYLTIPIATVGGAAVCTLLFLPCLPLRGVYFAVVTVIYPIAATKIITALNIWGGTEGLSGLSSFPNVWVDVYMIVAMNLVVLFALRRLVDEDYGLVLRGIKDDEQAVKASNINVTKFKAQAVFISSAIGCFAGSYLSHLYGWCGLSLFALDFSVLPIAASVMGGMGTLVGPLLGAAILVPLSESLRFLGTWRVVLYSIVLLAFIVFKPEGFMNYLTRKYYQFEHFVKV